MGVIIIKDDFIGFQEVVRGIVDDVKLDAYIDRFEKEYLYKLLGVALGDLLIADLANRVPQQQKYKDIFDPFTKQWGRQLKQSRGIKDLLLSVVFYHYVTETSVLHSQAGAAKSLTESFALSDTTRFGERRFNDSLETWEAIKWFIAVDTTNSYPDYVFQPVPKTKYGSLL